MEKKRRLETFCLLMQLQGKWCEEEEEEEDEDDVHSSLSVFLHFC
jgi:hypothetical protein